ncbi:MAG: PleD family two-component system response regulator [Alphaproteobacteria bacterium]
MSARVLVVDDVAVNVRLLEAKLAAEYYQVVTAQSGQEALDKIAAEKPDIVLLDVMMPGMDGFEVCRRIRAKPETANLPVVMVTALSEQEDRVRGLEAGADDFLTKPIEDEALFSRIRSLHRLKSVLDELKLREETSRALGVDLAPIATPVEHLLDGFRAVVVADDAAEVAEISAVLPPEMVTTGIAAEGEEGLVQRIVAAVPDIVLIDLHLGSIDALRVASRLRLEDTTRFSAILVIADSGDQARISKALELGVSDYIMRPVDPSELLARVRTQARHHYYRERLRGAYSESVSQAHTDPLTELFNRRYVLRHIEHLRKARREGAEPLAALMLDIDHFKAVNDTYGHDAGDVVLKVLADRLRGHLRGGDVLARLGGEEFLVVLPSATRERALNVAERLRHGIADTPIKLPNVEKPIPVTVSIGVTLDDGRAGSVEEIVKQADGALYRAKREGRNRVVLAEAVSAAA